MDKLEPNESKNDALKSVYGFIIRITKAEINNAVIASWSRSNKYAVIYTISISTALITEGENDATDINNTRNGTVKAKIHFLRS